MSGIYIPDMETPKPDEVIHIYNNGEARKCHIFEQNVIEVSVAIPVPDHGLLLDADIRENKHGKWIPPRFAYPWYKATCSICGYEDPLSYGGEWNGKEWKPTMNFCPNCGAELMEEQVNE